MADGERAAGTDLAARVQRLEDERDIRQVIDLAAMLADAKQADAIPDLYTEDCVIDLGSVVPASMDPLVQGRDALRARYAKHASTVPTHHLAAGPEAIVISGDEAQAIAYTFVSIFEDGAAKPMVTGFNFWRLKRSGNGWRIAHRALRRLGDEDVLDLFRPVVRQVLYRLG
jgi:ketosteroid isomerase-like protein